MRSKCTGFLSLKVQRLEFPCKFPNFLLHDTQYFNNRNIIFGVLMAQEGLLYAAALNTFLHLVHVQGVWQSSDVDHKRQSNLQPLDCWKQMDAKPCSMVPAATSQTPVLSCPDSGTPSNGGPPQALGRMRLQCKQRLPSSCL